VDDDEALELPSLWHEAEEDINHGKFHKAIEIYKHILIGYGDSNSAAECAHARVGNIFLMLGRTSEGENHIRKALSYDLEENHFCHYLLGFIYQQRYEWNNAIQEYRLALACDPWNKGYLRALGVAVFNSGDKEKGLEYLHQVVPLYQENSGMLT
jgi:tetratricopeptide (TPR) repeat protein